MAYIPDDAIEDCTSISASAFRLYCLICKRRNHANRYAFLHKKTASRLLGLSRSQTFRAFNELESAQWILIEGIRVSPIYGDFSPVNRNVKSATSNLRNETDSRKNDTSTISLPAFVTSPAFSNGLPGKKSRGWFCQSCKNSGMIFEAGSDGRPCKNCDMHDLLTS